MNHEITDTLAFREVATLTLDGIKFLWRGTVRDGATVTIQIPPLSDEQLRGSLDDFDRTVLARAFRDAKIEPNEDAAKERVLQLARRSKDMIETVSALWEKSEGLDRQDLERVVNYVERHMDR